MRRYFFTLPIYYTIEKKTKKNKTVLVGMNFFRNAHYHIKNKLKQHYHKLVSEQLESFSEDKKIEQFKTHYKLYYKVSNCDMTNISSLIEKFVLDGLKEFGLIIDDNVKYHISSKVEVIEQDKKNPRIEIIVEEIEKGN